MGPLRQNVFACLTCNPAPSNASDSWTTGGVCYACSIQCHGEHTLVEIFQKRNFTCDCGTTRFPAARPCVLRFNKDTNTRGGVSSEEADANNKYNHNFRNRFCGCECDYDPFQQKGTMFQCLGLGTTETGGCGEDWYHPGCLVGMGPRWWETMKLANGPKSRPPENGQNGLPTISESNEGAQDADEADGISKVTEALVDENDDPPMPPGFPDEKEFEGFICYKCVESNPWIKRYAGSSGFLPAVQLQPSESPHDLEIIDTDRKRKAEGELLGNGDGKRSKNETFAPRDANSESASSAPATLEPATAGRPSDCKLPNLPLAFQCGRFSLFFKEDFREKFCRCSSCYRHLNAHPQLLEEEEVYEPPISDGADSQHDGRSTGGSGSLLERGESALHNMDRVRAIEGVMAYNHLKERLKPFFQQFAESGQAIGAEDIKAYFAKLRGDEQGIQEAGEAARSEGGGGERDSRREQDGH